MRNKDYRYFVFFMLLFVVKVGIVMYTQFDIDTENRVQDVIMVISPISSILLALTISMLFSDRYSTHVFFGMVFGMSFILFGNVMFYRFFSDYITLPLLFQTSNMSDLGSSVTTLLEFSDLWMFLDVMIIGFMIYGYKFKLPARSSRSILIAASCAVYMFLYNLGMSETERPELLTRAFDREMLIKNIGVFNYHMYDAVLQAKTASKKIMADEGDLEEVRVVLSRENKDSEIAQDVDEVDEVSENEMTGKLKGKNVVIISMESLQSFVINNEVDGEVITPFLNKLIKESFYFPNFYHQTAQGKTSDSEFLLNNSLYPLSRGSVFFTNAGNTYDGLPSILESNGYSTSVQHANNSSFWNRDVMYESLGYGRFYDIEDFDVREDNSVGWGLKDADFFLQSIEHLKEQKALEKPFYSKYITLTNHFPFELEEEDKFIKEWNSGSRTLNRYFPTVRYMDESIKMFFESLKTEGLYEDTVFVLYGDHYGISENHNRSMAKFIGTKVDDFEHVQLQRVPLIIHVPGMKGKVVEDVVGQIDLKPTIMNMLGISDQGHLMLGTDIFKEDRVNRVVLRDGSVITDELLYTNGVCYKKEDKSVLSSGECDVEYKKGMSDLDISDRIIYGDLLRFSELDSNSVVDESEIDAEKKARELINEER